MTAKIITSNGETVSTHRTLAAAEKELARLRNYRCGICGSTRGGFGRCSHGAQNRVCSAEHYNSKIVRVA
jgi:hypothetical protein